MSRALNGLIVISGLLVSCHAKEPKGANSYKAVVACMEATGSHDDYFLTTKCEPLSSQRTFRGTWFLGFEMSAFREGYTEIPATLGENPMRLVAPTAVTEKVHATDSIGPSAYQVTFLGRESALPPTPGGRLVVADRILSLRPVAMSSSVSKPNG
jgi:hypothetical protein